MKQIVCVIWYNNRIKYIKTCDAIRVLKRSSNAVRVACFCLAGLSLTVVSTNASYDHSVSSTRIDNGANTLVLFIIVEKLPT